MPKMVVIDATQVNYQDGRGGVHEDVGAEIEVNNDVGMDLAKAGKAMFADPEADPSKGRYLLPGYIREALEAQKADKATAQARAAADAAARAKADAEAAAKAAAGQK